ncbi:acyl-CoA dehydrogenase family protein [Streptomyces boluensis]|uniref:Acyl-CoA dehydrogenase n=1 Tax=Streptomyces boluensis TaxID=1775135 RepID=A0A964UU09_9ACTN|nr:acyl-CoA dehydrogenase family protein [Streptomyces boluensis]NBE55424.1 acyl-CoA dehydrogenase [Streptomyces boluensis]
MRFLLDDEHRDFARSLDKMLTAAGPAKVARAWAAGDTAPGRAVWAKLAEAGVLALAVPEKHGGLGPLPVELAVAFEQLGRHAVPGPLVETVAAAALLDHLGDATLAADLLPGIAAGTTIASLRAPDSPYALDADAADTVLVTEGDTEGDTGGDTEGATLLLAAGAGPVQPSSDPARRLARPLGGTVLAQGPEVTAAAGHAAEVAAFAVAAQALGVGRTLLLETVEYVGGRTQFGVAIGTFQAVKHRLADTLIALEFAQPLVHAAALALASGDPDAGRAVAAAKVAACEATYTAARTALQLHGAVGYTDELDLSLWIRKARALRTAWGTPSACRTRVLAP